MIAAIAVIAGSGNAADEELFHLLAVALDASIRTVPAKPRLSSYSDSLRGPVLVTDAMVSRGLVRK